MNPLMSRKVVLLIEALPTFRALIRSLSRVEPLVNSKRVIFTEAFSALRAYIGLFYGMHFFMDTKDTAVNKTLSTHGTYIRSFA